jgi:hypothetical protein
VTPRRLPQHTPLDDWKSTGVSVYLQGAMDGAVVQERTPFAERLDQELGYFVLAPELALPPGLSEFIQETLHVSAIAHQSRGLASRIVDELQFAKGRISVSQIHQ